MQTYFGPSCLNAQDNLRPKSSQKIYYLQILISFSLLILL